MLGHNIKVQINKLRQHKALDAKAITLKLLVVKNV